MSSVNCGRFSNSGSLAMLMAIRALRRGKTPKWLRISLHSQFVTVAARLASSRLEVLFGFTTDNASKIVLALLAVLVAPFILLIILYIWNLSAHSIDRKESTSLRARQASECRLITGGTVTHECITGITAAFDSKSRLVLPSRARR
jgi:hypothetical protein